ncbi:MAG: GDP-mannose 4,6-dehydratase, partial [Solirubrobacterales bacterium]|nr:GDP-mannose 4,6-dehydratase [Solirubrobacterales bacterium]
VFGDGTQTRDFTYVDNVVEANLKAAAAEVPGGRVYNIAGGTPHSLADVMAALSAFAGRELTVDYRPPRPGDILHSHADVSAAARELSWRPSVPFAEGLRRTFEWYRQRQ